MAGKKLRKNKEFFRKPLYLISLGKLWDEPRGEGE